MRLLILLILGLNCATLSASEQPYFHFPQAFETGDYAFTLGLSLTRFPTEIVEEEINHAPMLLSGFRVGLGKRLDLSVSFNFNYIANDSRVDLQWNIYSGRMAVSVGGSAAIWFGHLDLDLIRLKSMGVVASPFIKLGYRARTFLLTARLEVQNSYMKTQSADILLAEFYNLCSAYGIKVDFEQPLWGDNWINIGVKLTHAKFYYASWLAYSTLNEYLTYPELSLEFIL